MAERQSQTLWDILDQFRWHWRSWEDFRSSSWFTKFNYTNFFMLIFFVGLAFYQARYKAERMKTHGPNKQWLPAPDFPNIEELPDFSWKDEQPLKIRTFKPKYHLTMDFDETALQKLDPSDLLLVDNTYQERIEYRKKIIKEYPDVAITVNDDKRVNGAVQELYTWIMGSYLPNRYPRMFKLHHASFETGVMYMLENLVTKAILPAKASPVSRTTDLLQNLGKTVDEDFLFLVPEDAEDGKEEEAKYVLEALVCVCPSGWDPREKTGKRLAAIHTPVPGYSKILEGSMDRYLNKIQVGEYVKRTNWSITTHGELFSFQSGSNHAHEGEEIEELQDMDPENTFLRCERQTLHRLPKSKAIIFAFKTYMYNIKEIKDEGSGPELAEAIDGMKDGNVPTMHFYKRGPVWGSAVKRYLRS